MQKLAWELKRCREKFSLLERFYQKWTIFWPRPGQSRPDPDNKGQTKRARSRPDRASQTCTKHRACGGKLPNAGQARARQSRQRASKNRAKSKRYVHKTPRLSQKIGRKQANQSKAEANKGKQETGKKQAGSPENAAPVHRKRAATCQTKQARSKQRQARTGRTVASIAQFTG